MLRTFVGHEKSLNSLNFTPDGEHLITASSDCTVRLWEMQTDEALAMFEIEGSAANLSPQNTYLGAVDQAWLTGRAVPSRKFLKRCKPFPKRTTALSFSPQEHLLALGGQGEDILIQPARPRPNTLHIGLTQRFCALSGFFPRRTISGFNGV